MTTASKELYEGRADFDSGMLIDKLQVGSNIDTPIVHLPPSSLYESKCIPIASELFEMSDKILNSYLKCNPIIVLTMWSLVVSIIVQEDSSEPFLVIMKGEECEVKKQTLAVSCLVAFIMLNQ